MCRGVDGIALQQLKQTHLRASTVAQVTPHQPFGEQQFQISGEPRPAFEANGQRLLALTQPAVGFHE